MVVFATVATLIGTQELALVYVPVILPLMIALRFDSVTAAGVALLATTSGFTAGVLNPVNTGLGQTIAELPLWSGLGLRAVLFVCILGAGIAWLVRYAVHVRANPELGLLAGDPKEAEKRRRYQHATDEGALEYSSRQRLAGITALVFFGILVWGVLSRGWFMMEMSGLFILMGIAVGLVGGLKANAICDAFNEGHRRLDVTRGRPRVGAPGRVPSPTGSRACARHLPYRPVDPPPYRASSDRCRARRETAQRPRKARSRSPAHPSSSPQRPSESGDLQRASRWSPRP
jgi:uncharacterized ion transporter superfamily protein YfcC